MQTRTDRSNRRQFLARLGAAALAAPAFNPSAIAAQTSLDVGDFGLSPDAGTDQSTAFQAAVDAAARAGLPLFIPAGTIYVGDIELPEGLSLQGVRGRSRLAATGDNPIARVHARGTITLADIVFEGGAPLAGNRGLLELDGTADIGLYRCSFRNSSGSGVRSHDSQVVIDDCDFAALGDAAIHSMDSKGGLTITGCRIADCGNAGIRIWRGEIGEDGSIVANNRISGIDWRGGGNGQNGNGINIFRAGGVIASGNHISDCAFTAVRLNGSRNSQVTGNICRDSGEVAIFSEFEFSGSLIANNIVDGAAGGISITNLDRDGHLAVCSGNIVRNIAPLSSVNPDVLPFGIHAEAETIISGNTVEDVPGIAISAGFGPYLRNVVISGNLVHRADIGIGVSVVEGAGAVLIADNLVTETLDHAVAGLRWREVFEPDLLANAGRYPNVSVGG